MWLALLGAALMSAACAEITPDELASRYHAESETLSAPSSTLAPTDSDTVDLVLAQLDTMLQYHDDVEPKEMMEGDDEDDADHDGFFGFGSCDNDGGGGSG